MPRVSLWDNLKLGRDGQLTTHDNEGTVLTFFQDDLQVRNEWLMNIDANGEPINATIDSGSDHFPTAVEAFEQQLAMNAEDHNFTSEMSAELDQFEQRVRQDTLDRVFTERYGAALVEAELRDAQRLAEFEADDAAKLARESQSRHQHGIGY